MKNGIIKKPIAVVVCVVLFLSLAACGGNLLERYLYEPVIIETPPTPTEISPSEITSWEMINVVDDFGDATGEKAIRGFFSGRFSNTATSGSDLSVYVFCSEDGSLRLRLLEYGNRKLSSTHWGEYLFRTKVDGVEESFYISWDILMSPDLYFKDSAEESVLRNYFYDGKEVRCLIRIQSSEYNFTIDGKGFSNLYDEVTQTASPTVDVSDSKM